MVWCRSDNPNFRKTVQAKSLGIDHQYPIWYIGIRIRNLASITMKDTTIQKNTSFEDRLFDANMKAAIAFGIAMIVLLLLIIAFYK